MRIAIIGGIGSGKSEVLSVAEELNIATLSADKINADLLKTPEYVDKLAALFPRAVQNGVLDKAALSAIVFSDDAKRLQLNSLAHPEIAKRILACKENPLVVELPLALESGALNFFDEVILIETNKKNRTVRLLKRGLDKQRVRAIMKAQFNPKFLKKHATRIIKNNKDITSFRDEAKKLLAMLIKEE